MIDWATATKEEKKKELKKWFTDNNLSIGTLYARCRQFDECNRWDTSDDLVAVCQYVRDNLPGTGMTHARMVAIYGEEYGNAKWKRYCERQAYTNSQEYHGMTDEEFKAYNKSRACTKENFIKRHGENEGIKRWDAYVARQVETKSKPYWVAKYGEAEWDAHCKRLKPKDPHSTGYSPISQVVFDSLKKLLSIDLQYATNGRELKLAAKNGLYFYDCFAPDAKAIVEFQGDMWHANPQKYKAEDHPNPYAKDLTAADIWAYDEHKRATAEDHGYKVFYIWESDYRYDPEGTVAKVAKEIKALL